MVDWENSLQLRFNAEKCNVRHMGKNNRQHCYKMRKSGSSESFALEKLKIEDQVDKDLRFSQHIETQANKANRLLGFIRRSYEHVTAE